MLIENDGDGNTRLVQRTNLSVHCDYLRITARNLSLDEFEGLLKFLSPKYNLHLETPWSPGAGAIWFPHKITAIRGLVGGWEIDDGGGVTVMVDLPGEYWERYTPEGQWRIFRGLKHTYNTYCNRIDIAIDDFTYQVIPIDDMRKAYHEQHNFHFRKYRQHITYEDSGAKPSITDEFGSRNSGKFVRIYDHDEECLRFEAEFKRGYAPQIFDMINSLERSEYDCDIASKSSELITEQEISDRWNLAIQRFMAGLAVGALDFRDRGNSNSAHKVGVRDSKRLVFYQKFIDSLQTESYRVRLPDVPRSADKTFEWVKRQCSATLAMFKEGLGAADFFVWVNQLLEYGRSRMDRLKLQWATEISKYKHRFEIAK